MPLKCDYSSFEIRFFFKPVILLRNYVIFHKKLQFCGFFRSFFIFIKLFNIYWKITIILLSPLFSTLKNEENGLPKNCYTTNRKHCVTVQVWGVVEPQWILRGGASSVDPSRVKNQLNSWILLLNTAKNQSLFGHPKHQFLRISVYKKPFLESLHQTHWLLNLVFFSRHL